MDVNLVEGCEERETGGLEGGEGKLPYLVYWKRHAEFALMVFNNHTVQVNLLNKHYKIALTPSRNCQDTVSISLTDETRKTRPFLLTIDSHNSYKLVSSFLEVDTAAKLHDGLTYVAEIWGKNLPPLPMREVRPKKGTRPRDLLPRFFRKARWAISDPRRRRQLSSLVKKPKTSNRPRSSDDAGRSMCRTEGENESRDKSRRRIGDRPRSSRIGSSDSRQRIRIPGNNLG
jgi:hypothetical protein